MLVDDMVALAKEGGAAAIWAGTGDETNSTSFSKFDLYRETSIALENIEAPDDHAVNFWRAIGFAVVGVMPDDGGLGKPAIYFAKRIASRGT